jgi:uncharacterized membrane protein YadS
VNPGSLAPVVRNLSREMCCRAVRRSSAYDLWTGLAVDNTAEATAAGALYSDAAGKYAVLAKTCRNACIGFVVLGYTIYWARKGQAAAIAHKGSLLWQKFPKFVLGFLLIPFVATIGTLDPKVFPQLAWLIPTALPGRRFLLSETSAAGHFCLPSPGLDCGRVSKTC